MSHRDLERGSMFQSTVSLFGIRKSSKTVFLFVIISVSLVLLVSWPRVQTTFQDLQNYQTDETTTQSHIPQNHEQKLENAPPPEAPTDFDDDIPALPSSQIEVAERPNATPGFVPPTPFHPESHPEEHVEQPDTAPADEEDDTPDVVPPEEDPNEPGPHHKEAEEDTSLLNHGRPDAPHIDPAEPPPPPDVAHGEEQPDGPDGVHTEHPPADPAHPEPAHPRPDPPAPAHSEPAHPEPPHPGPAHPDPAQPEPVHPDAAHPEPPHPEPVHPDPAHPEPPHPNPAHPEQPPHPEPAHPEQPLHPDPAHPEPPRPDNVHPGDHAPSPSPDPNAVHEPPPDRRFVVVIPATAGNPDLCKTIVTALALGYPSPIIINWDVDYHDITHWEGGANLPKIPGFVNYLDAVMHPQAHPSEQLREDDLVLMVDAYDVWFQLPAEVMVKRYHQINEEANARLREQWPGEDPMPMRQTVIAASGKNCHPQPSSGSNCHCDELPDSPLREDLYGPETERNATKHRDHRPKYINGGVYMGPAGDMRRLFRRAMEKMISGLDQGVRLFSEQGIPGEVLGEQEVWRKWRRNHTEPSVGAMALMERDFEYHFGLDYGQRLSVQTFWTDTEDGLFDGAYVQLNNQSAIDAHSADLGISPVRLKGVPADVRAAKNPLAYTADAPDWGDMPLYADFFTESVPVILHHNGFKDRRLSWWDKPWFHQRLRRLLTTRMTPVHPAVPLVTVDAEDMSIKYWATPSEDLDRRPRLMGNDALSASAMLPKMEFHDVCHYPKETLGGPLKHWWQEVFRDTGGPFF